MKKLFVCLLILALAALPGWAQETAVSAVTGDWYAQLDGMPLQLTLAGDGGYALSFPGGEPITGTWELNGGYLYMDGAETPDITILGDEMLLMSDGVTVFTREKPEAYAPADILAETDLALFAGYWKSAYIEMDGVLFPAIALDDQTDLYVEGMSVTLGGPLFDDVTVPCRFEDGALVCQAGESEVKLQMQQDTLLRMTLTGAGDDTQIIYLQAACFPAPETDPGEDEAP